MKKYGDRTAVFNGEAEKTRGGLTKDDLMVSRTGRIVSKKKSLAASESYKKFGFKKRVQEEEEKVVEEEKPKKRRKRKSKAKKSDE